MATKRKRAKSKKQTVKSNSVRARTASLLPTHQNKAILVLGMHRSGTSALTRVFNLLGADLPGNIMGPGVGNDTGHWESTDIANIHDEMLHAAGSSWHDWRKITPDWMESSLAEAARERLLAVIKRDFHQSPLFAVKDPRVCRFVPLWLDVLKRFGANAVPILPVRSPLEVAASLRRRDGFPLTKSYLLWLRHVLDAERATRHLARAIVTYDLLMDDWRAVAARISEITGVRWPRWSDRSELEIDRFLTETHRHHISNETQLEARADVADWVKETYAILLAMSRGTERVDQHLALDRISTEFNQAAAAFGLLLAGEVEDAETRAQVALNERNIARTTLAEREETLAAATSALQQTQQQVADYTARIRALENELVATRGRAHDAEAGAVARNQEAERFHYELEAARNLLRDSQTEAQRLGGDIAQAAERLREAHSRIETLTEERDAARARVNEAEMSTTAYGQDGERLRHELEMTRSLLRDSQTEAQRFGGDVAKAAERLHEARARTDALTAERDAARSELATREAELSKTRAVLLDTQQNAAATAAALQAKNAELAAAETRAKQNEAQTEAIRCDLDLLSRELETNRHLLQRDQNAAQRLRAQIEQAEQRHRETEARVTTITYESQKMLAVAHEDHEMTRRELSVTQTVLRDARRENELVENNLRRVSQEAEQAKRDLACLHDITQQTQSQLQHDIAARDALAAELERDLAKLRTEAEALRAKQQSEERQRLEQTLAQPRGWSWLRLWRRSPTARQLREMEAIRSSGLFDPLWYLKRYPDVAAAGQDPLIHYVLHGGDEGRDPHPLFDGKWYLEQYPNCNVNQLSPLGHYVLEGAAKGYDPNPLFDTDWYLQQYPEAAKSGLNPLQHFWTISTAQGYNPNPLFSTSWYFEQNGDVRRAGDNALYHYRTYGWREHRDPHPEFSAKRYVETYPDVSAAGVEPLEHFLRFGRSEGRQHSPSSTHDQSRLLLPPSSQLDIPLQLETSTELKLLPSRLLKLIDMFHDRSTATVLDNCYDLLARFDGFEISGEIYRKTADLVDLMNKTRHLAKSYSDNRPHASIIIPVHNKFLYTACCLYSLLSTQHSLSFEIILADDLSSDATSDALSDIGGLIRYIRNETNLGFLRNCNSAAKHARGDIIVFLNNDTFVLPNWLDELIAPLDENQSIGLTGSKLVNADGSLQEAGGIVWRDASAWNFGRGDDACAPQYNYLKNVDYISGASIAIRSSLWKELRGFDEHYAPAYFEDTDLAFRVREREMRVVYNPHSAVIHHEGVSHGRDTSKGLKAYQELNKRKFQERWRNVLEDSHFSNGENVVVARDRTTGKPRILIVDHYIPQPDRDAGSRSMWHYLELFAKSGFHTIFWPHNRHFDPPYAKKLQSLGVETIYGYNDIWPEFECWLAENNAILNYAFLSRPSVTKDFIDAIRGTSAATILFYGHDIHFRRLILEYEITKQDSSLAESKEIEKVERDIWGKSDVVYYPSVEEEHFVKSELPNLSVRTLPLYIYEQSRLIETANRLVKAQLPKTNRLLFIGGFRHKPNVDAVMWFHSVIWPLVRNQISDATWVIAGSSPPAEVQQLQSSHIHVTGSITDEELAEQYRQTSVAIVPLRYGAGMKGKVLEALSFGVPLITTRIGVQGLEFASSFCSVVDDPEKFAEATINVLRNPFSYLEKSKKGLAFIEANFSLAAAKFILSEKVRELR